MKRKHRSWRPWSDSRKQSSRHADSSILRLVLLKFGMLGPKFLMSWKLSVSLERKYSVNKYLVNKATVGATDGFLSLIYCYVENRFTLLNNDKRIRGFGILVCLTSIL